MTRSATRDRTRRSKGTLFDDFVRQGEQLIWNSQVKRPGSLKGTSNNTRCLTISALAERAVAAFVPKGVSDRGPFCAGGRPRGPLHDATRTPPVSALKRAQPPPA